MKRGLNPRHLHRLILRPFLSSRFSSSLGVCRLIWRLSLLPSAPAPLWPAVTVRAPWPVSLYPAAVRAAVFAASGTEPARLAVGRRRGVRVGRRERLFRPVAGGVWPGSPAAAAAAGWQRAPTLKTPAKQ